MRLNVIEELQRIWGTISTTESSKDSGFDIYKQKKLLDIFHVGQYYCFIFNVRKSLMEMVSPDVEHILGYAPEQITLPFFTEIIHHDDLPYYLNFETTITKFFNGISGTDLFKYKAQYDFRIKKADGDYIRILNQFMIIQHDSEDVRTFVINTDISHLKKDGIPALSFIGLEGEPSYYNVAAENIFKPVKPVFTKREKDILRSLARGMNSIEISDALHISKHTVDSHRKNMLKKTAAKSTNEIIGLAFNNGWV